MIARRYIATAILCMPVASKAQPTTEHTNILWASCANTIHFNKSWSLISDVQVRTKDWADKWLLYAIRTGLGYNFNEHLEITGGLTLFRNAQYAGKLLFFKNEWRPWEELSYQFKLHKINLLQRLRTEQRFLQEVENNQKTDNYQYMFRLRYRFEWQFPVRKNFKVLIGNEVFVNPGYLNSQLFFDQNRSFGGINIQVSSTSALQAQYIKIFQWHSNSSVLDNQNAVRVNFIQQFNFQKNKSHITS